MAKRRVYTGVYHSRQAGNGRDGFEFSTLTDFISKFMRMIYSPLTSNYISIVSIVSVVLASMVLMPQEVHHNELKAMKTVLNRMTEDVDRAEVACRAAAEELCCLHSICDETTEAKQEHRNISMCTSRCLVATRSAPVQSEKESGVIRRAIYNRDTSQKEIAIMTIVYTDSFEHQTFQQSINQVNK